MKIAILIPSRRRPKELYRFFDSINKTISGQNDIMFYIGIDKDDPARQDYYQIINTMLRNKKDCMTICFIEGERRPVSKIWNELVRIHSWEQSADYFMMGGDDLIIDTKDWDIILEEKIFTSDHPFYLYWFDDGINGDKQSSFPIVSKHWVGAFGYFVPEIFNYFFIDTWLFDIAKKAEVLKYIPDIYAIHLHFTKFDNVPYDITYKENRINNNNQKDTDLFSRTEDKRFALSKLLRKRIDSWFELKKVVNENNSVI
jgi:hypothetical protein